MYDDPLDLHIVTFGQLQQRELYRSIQHLTKGIKQGHVDQTSPCFPNEAALHAAVTCGQHEIVELLLDHNCDVNVLDALGRTPLHRACRHGKVKIGLRLLETGKCDPSLRDVDGNTAYLLATRNPKSKEIADSLLFVSGWFCEEARKNSIVVCILYTHMCTCVHVGCRIKTYVQCSMFNMYITRKSFVTHFTPCFKTCEVIVHNIQY